MIRQAIEEFDGKVTLDPIPTEQGFPFWRLGGVGVHPNAVGLMISLFAEKMGVININGTKDSN